MVVVGFIDTIDKNQPFLFSSFDKQRVVDALFAINY